MIKSLANKTDDKFLRMLPNC